MPSSVNKCGLVPKLRFPEFRDAPEWAVKRVGDEFDFLPTATNSRADLSNSGDTFYIHYGDIHKKYSSYIYVPKANLPKIQRVLCKNASFVKNGDLIIADASEDENGIGKAVEILDLPEDEKVISGLHTILLRNKNETYGNKFIGKLFESNNVKKQLIRIAVGTKVYSVTKTALRNINLPTPSLGEQQKIADCLSSLDELIAAQAQKIAALKTHKKGLMQQLFPAEGETVPQLRFPEFRGAGEWESLPLGKKTELLSGFPFDGADISENSLGNILLRGINVTEGVVRHNQDIDRYYLHSTDKLDKYRVQIDDLVIAMDGSKVGKNTALISASDVGALLVQRVARLRAICVTSIQFIFQHINSSKFHTYVDKINTSSGIPHISAKQINEFQILFPCVEEQQKIANCLSSLDELIAAQAQKIAALKTHKKGLMQQLFPHNSNEVVA